LERHNKNHRLLPPDTMPYSSSEVQVSGERFGSIIK
jgi:hypothetical protein